MFKNRTNELRADGGEASPMKAGNVLIPINGRVFDFNDEHCA